MKKTFLKVFFSLFALSLFFSSCLGDNENTYKATNDFVYITQSDNGLKYAVLSAYPGIFGSLTGISDASVGSCYLLSYKINTSQVTQDGLYILENPSISTALQQSTSIDFYNAPPAPLGDSEVHPNSFTVARFFPYNLMGDRWLITLNLARDEGERIIPYVYFDTENQFEDAEKQKPVGTNQIILDVLFAKQNPTGAAGVTSDYQVVLNLSPIRTNQNNTTLFPDFEFSENLATVQVRFRYRKYKDATGAYDTTLYPSAWSSSPYMSLSNAE